MKRLVMSAALLALMIPSIAGAADYKIVVLPFDKINREKNQELETLSVGISETLSGALSNVNNFIVIDSFRVKKYLLGNAEFSQAIGADEDKNMERLRRLTQDKLNGDYIVYGSFYTIGGQINLDAKFVNVDSGKVLKAASVHGTYPDRIFDLQEELARKLTGAINGTVNERQTENMNEFISSTADYAAYQLYIRARVEHLKYNSQDYPKALELYKKAAAKDPKFALAWAGMSEVNSLWGYSIRYAGGNYRPKLEQAVRDGRKAVDLAPQLYQTHRALSLAYLNNDDFDRARAVIEQGYALNARDPEILFVKATVVNYGYREMGKPGTESNRFILQALEINPELIVARWALAHSLEQLGRADEAMAEYRKIVEANPGHAASLHNIALIHYGKKDYPNTVEYAQKAVAAEPSVPQYDCTLGLGYYGRGDWQNAEKAYRAALKKKPDYIDALFNLGGALYMQQRYREARDAYRGVLKLKPDYPNAETWMKNSEDMMKGGK
ncbi:MAG TPA: tetratricopeptide repeat protein [Spirochaetota bacterium]|nr:tetratricopeptide repeat protein [Spirochaetota bacterium]HOD15113.1 tetratricopeptide repeat protein [Spirochaetota bacterium]HPG51688.1 tetratricopeptide repeat protein [Spirochaetota bacterium]HPN12860.1 tetratricopeptide repeat protein [Spirochaetota bacterium]